MSEATRQTKLFYERSAPRYLEDRDPHFLNRYLKEFADFLLDEHPDNASILDIGAAGALRLPALERFLPKMLYESCDIAQSFVNMARDKYPNLHHFECNIAEADTLPQDRQYNGILCLSVLQHVAEEEIQHAICNVHKLLKHRGFALISLPTGHVGGYENDTRHFTILDHKAQQEKLEKAGFQIKVENTVPGFKSADNWYIYLVQRI